MKTKTNFYKMLSEYLNKLFGDCKGSYLSLEGVYSRDEVIVAISPLRG